MRLKFVSIDRTTPQMFAPRIEEYLPEDLLAQFVAEIVEQLDLKCCAIRQTVRST